MKLITLTRGFVSKVDDADFERLSQWNWHAVPRTHTTYVQSSSKACPYRTLHRAVLEVSDPSAVVDHIDHDGLNNQRSNLRVCTVAENMRNRQRGKSNTSGYKGVYFNKPLAKWMAYIDIGGKKRYLGLYVTPEAGARAYDRAARKYHGAFACLNFPNDIVEAEPCLF